MLDLSVRHDNNVGDILCEFQLYSNSVKKMEFSSACIILQSQENGCALQ